MLNNAINYLVGRLLPQKNVDASNNNSGIVREDSYGEQFVSNHTPDFGVSANEGSYWTVNAAQTAILMGAAQVAYGPLAPFISIYNSDSAANTAAKRIIMDYLMLLAVAPGTGGTSLQIAWVLDQGNKYSSGGTLLTPNIVNPNADIASGKSIAQVYAGALVTAALTPSARMIVGNRYLKGAIPVAGDQYSIKFGGVDAPAFIGISTILTSLNNVPKIVIPPGWTLTGHLWAPAQSVASSYLPEIGWQER